MSQEDLARVSGVSVRSIRNIESQRRRPRASTLRTLAESLNLSEAESAALAEAVRPEAPVAPPDPPAIVPRQLPAPPRGFTARETELGRFDAAADDAGGLLWLVTGSGGVGKTWLAVHWANARLDDFPDGQLYLNLRGFDPAAEPTSALSALRSLVSALGVPVGNAPGGLDDLSALYRSVTAGKRLLLLLDNARDAAQVAPLLPGGADCVTIVTSRDSLRELITGHGARLSRLETLTADESRRVLGTHIGEQRLDREAAAADALVAASAGLPLALGIIGALAAQYPKQPLSSIAAELAPQAVRRETDGQQAAVGETVRAGTGGEFAAVSVPASIRMESDGGELAAELRTVLDGSRRWLGEAASRLFDLLGLAPGNGCDLHAAASLAGDPIARVRPLLRELEDACLIDQDVPGHFRMHDLTHTYAREHADRRLRARAWTAALRRLVDHYAATAQLANDNLQPGLDSAGRPATVTGVVTAPIHDRAGALEWERREESNLVICQEIALQYGWYRSAWLMADGLRTFGDEELLSQDFEVRIWEHAVTAAERLGDLERIRAMRMLGNSRFRAAPNGDAGIAVTESALRLAVEVGDTTEQASAHFQLSHILGGLDRNDEALRHSFRVLANLDESESPRRVANAHNRLCWVLADVERFDEAFEHGRLALAIARDNELDFMAAMVLNSLGYIAFKAGRLDEAVDHYRHAHDIYSQVESNRFTEFNLDYLGDALSALGRIDEAETAWREAAELSEQAFRRKDAERVRAKLHRSRNVES